MDEERPSSTAEGAAIMRAIHQTQDGQPKILDDPIIPRLIDVQSTAYQSRVEFLPRLSEPTRLRFKSAFVLRCRFAEDCLAESVSNGTRQYVLLGAGLDTFAYRQPPWAKSLRIFEVDHPATQRWKRGRLVEAGVTAPDNVTFVPLDFENVSPAVALPQAGVDFRVATFFSMLGVSMYLTEAALEQTLKLVLSAPVGSEIVFSFAASDAVLPAEEVAFAKMVRERVAAMGEPILSGFIPEDLIDKLAGLGFSEVCHLSPEQANKRYFRDRSDGLNAPHGEQMIRATV